MRRYVCSLLAAIAVAAYGAGGASGASETGGAGKPRPVGDVLEGWRNVIKEAISHSKPIDLKPLVYGELKLRFDLSDEDALEFARSIEKIARIVTLADNRARDYHKRLAAQGRAEAPISPAAVRFELALGDTKLKFDRFGELFIDRRFVTKDELKTIKEVEGLYRKVVEKRRQADLRENKPKPIRLSSRETVEKVRPVPIFRGFEDDRYQRHDALILRLVKDFNANKAAWTGCTAKQAEKIPDLTPALVKSMMIEETGGSSAVSRAAWGKDPMQVNVPGDWDAAKGLAGLRKPKNRNEGTLPGNVRAAIKWLARKGFGVSGKPPAQRPAGFFDGWRTALKRYNARKGRTTDGRKYSDAYADKIIRRANNPDVFVPVELKLKK